MYADKTYADAYFLGTVNNAKWIAIDIATQPLLLDSASKYIDTAFKYSGTQTDELLAFPRASCVNSCTGITYLDDAIPEIVKVATCEIALQMSIDAELSMSSLNTFDGNIKSEKVGTLAAVYKDNTTLAKKAKEFGYTWLRCIIKENASVGSFRFVKG